MGASKLRVKGLNKMEYVSSINGYLKIKMYLFFVNLRSTSFSEALALSRTLLSDTHCCSHSWTRQVPHVFNRRYATTYWCSVYSMPIICVSLTSTSCPSPSVHSHGKKANGFLLEHWTEREVLSLTSNAQSCCAMFCSVITVKHSGSWMKLSCVYQMKTNVKEHKKTTVG